MIMRTTDEPNWIETGDNGEGFHLEDVIETILGVEIVDEKDMEGIEEGVVGEDMRQFAKDKSNVDEDE